MKHLFQLHLSIKDNIKQALKYNDIPKFINNCQIIFMFEEVERFLHPSLQKLVPTIFEEVYKDVLMEGENDKVVKERLKFLITTHSPYITNSALKISNQKVYHIENGECIDPNGVSGLEINTFNSIMDSLGVKPSDMLFANGIIWVEGSADVIYIQKWLDMYAKENNLIEFKQGFDYEFCMYGGALLKFLYGSNGDKLNKANLINIIRINTRKFLITDSDRQVLEAEDKSTFEEAKKLMQQCLGEDNFWCDPQVRTIEEYAVENKGKGMKGNKTWQYHPNCRYDASVDKTERAFKRVQLWEKENVKLRNFKPSLLTNISRLYEEIRKWNN
uniref:ATPase AAA-type core domain-containing protein n=1 Tax=Tolypothrix bouteillei VB521301 TaxID=1479485 RepID=A0A0C1NGJ5_9CYAN